MLFELLPYPMDIIMITFLKPSKFYITSKNQRPVTSTSGKVGGARLRRFMVMYTIEVQKKITLAVRQRRMRYLGHVLRMPPDRIVRRALVALVKGGTCYPEGSLFDDCGVASLRELVDTAKDRSAWRAKVASLTRQQ